MERKTPPFRIREDGLGWVETAAKTVGHVKTLAPAAALKWNSSMLKLSPLCGRWVPRGVYKFKTWEEEAEWTKAQILAANLTASKRTYREQDKWDRAVLETMQGPEPGCTARVVGSPELNPEP